LAALNRRRFILHSALVAGGCAAGLGTTGAWGASAPPVPPLVSPGCRASKLQLAKLYLGKPNAHWPTPKMDLAAERRQYEAAFTRMRKEFADVEWVVEELLTDKDQVAKFKETLGNVDGILAIHLSMGTKEIVEALLACRRPTMLFAAPYSGHEWSQFGALRQTEAGVNLECYLTSDLGQLAAAVRPIRAIHHLREAKVLNLTTSTRDADYVKAIAAKFGTQIKTIPLQQVLDAYERVSPEAAEAETKRWLRQAEKVLEPPRDEVFRSCRLALAFDQVVADEQATALTVECYGTMYRKLPAFPCLGFVRLNGLGLGGICESDLRSAVTYILLQGLSGRPSFISDPTMDESARAIILAHCLGSTKMDGPEGKAAPYRLRTIMERQEGCVPQVRMRVGQKVTQALLVGTDQLLYFTGDIIATPDVDRGCRTKITVKIDGDPQKLWQNWAHGLHRLTCYGDLTDELRRFCRLQGLKFIHEA
jgi:L-fucose isomerase-like protein